MNNKERIGGVIKDFPAQTYQPTTDPQLKMMIDDPYGSSSLVK
jgi:serine/threonine protein kinase